MDFLPTELSGKSWIDRVGPKLMTSFLIREGKGDLRYTDTKEKHEGHVKMEAEIGMMPLQVKEHQELPVPPTT